MNSTNINVQRDKSQQPAPGARLITLDSQLASFGYGVDHPWRLTLADIIADEVDAVRLSVISPCINPVQRQAHEIEGRIGNVAILIESIFDQLDAMKCHTPADHKLHESIMASANAVMESARAIYTANENILEMIGGMQ